MSQILKPSFLFPIVILLIAVLTACTPPAVATPIVFPATMAATQTLDAKVSTPLIPTSTVQKPTPTVSPSQTPLPTETPVPLGRENPASYSEIQVIDFVDLPAQQNALNEAQRAYFDTYGWPVQSLIVGRSLKFMDSYFFSPVYVSNETGNSQVMGAVWKKVRMPDGAIIDWINIPARLQAFSVDEGVDTNVLLNVFGSADFTLSIYETNGQGGDFERAFAPQVNYEGLMDGSTRVFCVYILTQQTGQPWLVEFAAWENLSALFDPRAGEVLTQLIGSGKASRDQIQFLEQRPLVYYAMDNGE